MCIRDRIIWQDPGQVHFIGSTGAESVYGIIKTDAKSKPVFQSIEKGFAISHFELAANGRGLFLADSYNHPTELFIEGAGQTAIKRMTDSNPVSVSYTHLDVYKRQMPYIAPPTPPALVITILLFARLSRSTNMIRSSFTEVI